MTCNMTFSVTLAWGQIFKLTFSGQLIGYSTRLLDVIFLWPMTSQDGKQGQIVAVYNDKHFIKVTYHLKETTKRWYLFSQEERGKYRRYYSRLLSVPNKYWKKSDLTRTVAFYFLVFQITISLAVLQTHILLIFRMCMVGYETGDVQNRDTFLWHPVKAIRNKDLSDICFVFNFPKLK